MERLFFDVQEYLEPDLWAPLVMEIADGSTDFLWSVQRSHRNRGTFLGSLLLAKQW